MLLSHPGKMTQKHKDFNQIATKFPQSFGFLEDKIIIFKNPLLPFKKIRSTKNKARKSSIMNSDTDVNKSASLTPEEQPKEPDGPLPGSVNDQEKKVRLSPATMSTKNSTDLVEYVDKGHSFLPVIPNTNRSHLEDRLNNQERTIAFLLEQAFRIKEDISACLQGTHGFRKEESLARKLLENHIQTITSIVKKLSQNIEILEDQIRARDQAATGTNFAVQELNTKHLQGVGDLRGRVARCDSSIVKLSGDIHFIRHEHRKIEKTIQDFMSALETVSKNLDMKVIQLLGKIEASSSEQISNLKMVQGDYRHEMNLLEFKFNLLSNNLCEEIENHQKWTKNQFVSYEKDHLGHINQCLKLLQEKLEKSENKMKEKLLQLSSKLENFINTEKQEAELSKVKHIENKLSKKMQQLEKHIWGELEKMQNEYQSGFKSIHDSLNSLQQIQKTKMDLEKYKVQKDLKKLQRKIVELQEV
ncbi:protein FAM81B isoform X1 [Canis lupus familiaris]|uniref:protein FAM81B isoform X1 n=1 Tax=Canis lupus familiaris TaxID=9615 RepID=UPI0012363921|nr:protein FAM81B isoform X1 [Canis lupus familiaris]XP_038516726.1 protein FAM81B isoform X1 [Canis lupus familiaris]XP_546022.4 protein FAM81B isoform X1 [Canis lupus familiaris]